MNNILNSATDTKTMSPLVKPLEFDIKGDKDGCLVALEENKNIPFDIKRVYYIFGTQKNIRRGFHAHKQITQVAICINGSCTMLLDNGEDKEKVVLDSPQKGLLIETMVWHEMFDFSENCVLMVLADDFYSEDDYIRDYDQFLNFKEINIL